MPFLLQRLFPTHRSNPHLPHCKQILYCLSQAALVLKNPPANIEDTRDLGSVPGLGRYPGVGNGSPLQYSCLENPLDRGAWLTTLHGVTKSWARLKQLSTHTLAPECFTWEVIVPCMCIYTQLESVAMASEHFQTFFTHCRQILGQTP